MSSLPIFSSIILLVGTIMSWARCRLVATKINIQSVVGRFCDQKLRDQFGHGVTKNSDWGIKIIFWKKIFFSKFYLSIMVTAWQIFGHHVNNFGHEIARPPIQSHIQAELDKDWQATWGATEFPQTKWRLTCKRALHGRTKTGEGSLWAREHWTTNDVFAVWCFEKCEFWINVGINNCVIY